MEQKKYVHTAVWTTDDSRGHTSSLLWPDIWQFQYISFNTWNRFQNLELSLIADQRHSLLWTVLWHKLCRIRVLCWRFASLRQWCLRLRNSCEHSMESSMEWRSRGLRGFTSIFGSTYVCFDEIENKIQIDFNSLLSFIGFNGETKEIN